jgi:hypothetical protein
LRFAQRRLRGIFLDVASTPPHEEGNIPPPIRYRNYETEYLVMQFFQCRQVDVMRVQNGKITDHWGVGNLLSLMQQIGGWTPSTSDAISRDA